MNKKALLALCMINYLNDHISFYGAKKNMENN